MPTIQSIRQQYPQYGDMSDQQLADALHSKYYSDMPQQQFYSKIGYAPPAPMPIGERIGADALGGLAQMGHGLLNAPHNLVNLASPSIAAHIPTQQNYDFAKMLGVTNPNLGDKIVQGAAQYLPYALGGQAALAAKGAESIPLLSRAGNLAGTGAVFGATQSENPIRGAALGAGLNLAGGAAASAIGKGAGIVFNSPNTMNALKNTILDYLGKSAKNSSALSPEETAENVGKNYTNVDNSQMPVDIGTAVNNPTLSNIYSGLRYSPGSGVATKGNQVKAGMSDVAINNAQQNIAKQQQDYLAQKMQAQQSLQQNKSAISQTFTQQMDAIKNDSTAAQLNDQFTSLSNEQKPYAQAINNAPSYLSGLVNPEDRPLLTKNLKDETKAVYDANRTTSNANYEPINNSKIRLDVLAGDNYLPKYQSAATDLLSQRENLNNIFGSDSDLGTMLNGELNKAESIIKNKSDSGMTLQEGIQRIQNLGKLAASATATGNRNQGRLLGNLRDSLEDDVHNILNESGNSDISNKLITANDYFKNNIVPFWSNNEIRKSVTDASYIPTKAKLATALHDPNNQSVLNSLPQRAKNMALTQLITGGKGASDGSLNLTAQDIGNAYSKLPVDTKNSIASYNPTADKYFENLPQMISTHEQIQSARSTLQDQLYALQNASKESTDKLQSQMQSALSKLQSRHDSSMQKLDFQNNKASISLQKQLEELKNKKFGLNTQGSTFGEAAGKGGLAAGAALGGYLSPYSLVASVPLGFAAKNLGKALSDPELIKAYINNTRFPVRQQNFYNPAISSPAMGAIQNIKENNNGT